MPSASYLLTNSSQPAPTQNRRWLADLLSGLPADLLANGPANSRNLLTWLPVTLFLGIFAMESTRVFGADHTSAPLQRLLHFFCGKSLDANWSYIHHMIRKTGHFTAYGTFSFFAYQAAAHTLRSRMADKFQRQQLSHILAVAATLVAASADEIHQCFLPNRTGCLADVLLDTAGAFTVQLALVVLIHLAAPYSKARAKSLQASEINPEPAIAV